MWLTAGYRQKTHDMEATGQTVENGTRETAPATTRVMVVDDHAVVVEGIKSAIAGIEGFVWVGKAGSGREAMELIPRLRPDILIMDISLGDGSGVDFSKRIKVEFPGTKIIIYSMFSDKEYVIELFKAQISGYVRKQDSFDEFIMALKVVKTGGTYFNHVPQQYIADHLAGDRDTGLETLSRREFEIFRLLADGKSVKEVGLLLNISPITVETHKYHIMAKL